MLLFVENITKKARFFLRPNYNKKNKRHPQLRMSFLVNKNQTSNGKSPKSKSEKSPAGAAVGAEVGAGVAGAVGAAVEG